MCRGDGVAAAPQHAIDAAEAERRRREKQQKGTPTRTIVSFRKTRSIEKYFAGLNPPSRFASWYNILAETAVVCVRRIASDLLWRTYLGEDEPEEDEEQRHVHRRDAGARSEAEPLSEVAADEEASRDDARHERQYHLQVALKRARPQHEYYFSRHFLRLNS